MTTETVMSSYPNANRVHQVTRVTPSDKLLATSVLHIEQKITAELEREFKSIQESTQHLANAVAPMRALIEQDHRAVTSLDALHKLAKEEQQRRVEVFKQATTPELVRTFSFTANPGFNVLVPPYDVEWSTGVGPFVKADKASGELVCSITHGFVAAAVGVFLSSPVKASVRFSPVAPFSYTWTHFPFRGPTSGKGGVGVLAYCNEDKQPFLENGVLLWNDSRDFPAPIASGSGDSFVSAALPRYVLMMMEPGNTYLVWVWCWEMAHNSTTDGHEGLVLDEIRCTVPFIVVDAGPPPHIG